MYQLYTTAYSNTVTRLQPHLLLPEIVLMRVRVRVRALFGTKTELTSLLEADPNLTDSNWMRWLLYF